MFKNVASQKLAVFAWDNAAGAAKTGDAANISAQISIDGAATAATNDVAPTELDATDAKGVYLFDLTQAETNGDLIIVSAVSATADIDIRPVFSYTVPAALIDWQDGGRLDLLLDAIKTVTDKFVFTTANEVDANVHSVNDVPVTGTGTAGDPWGP